jgi:PKD repeat protein
MAVAACVASAGCTVHKTDTPDLMGPSEFGVSIDVAASPDAINRNGVDSSTIQVRVLDENGKPKSGQELRLAILVNNIPEDLGTLSPRSVTTDANGTAAAVYTAPPAGGITFGSTIAIGAATVGTNAQTAQWRTADIRLIPLGVVQPPAEAPTAQFTLSPTVVNFDADVTFDASDSCAGPLTNGACPAPAPGATAASITSYVWDFDDGGSATGQVVHHTFALPSPPPTGDVKNYRVTLTVTNSRGLTAVTRQTIPVSVP